MMQGRSDMRALFRVTAFIFYLGLITAPEVAAQALIAGTWNISPMAGVSFDPDGRAATNLGIGLGYDWTERVALEAEINRILDLRRDDDEIDAALTTAAFNVRYHFGGPRVTPYVAAGLGVGWYSLDYVVPPAMVDVTAFGVNLGGGILYALNSRAGLRGDFRYFNHTHGEESDPQGFVTVDDVPTTWRIVGAITVHLGR
jgi:hypothetical protein